MSLRIELKPHEKIIIGSSVITNGDARIQIYVDGQDPILREKDIFTAETANTPAKRIYLVVQLMYLDKNIENHRDLYFSLIQDFVAAAPSALKKIDAISNEILTGSLYHALKKSKELIVYEQELIGNV